MTTAKLLQHIGETIKTSAAASFLLLASMSTYAADAQIDCASITKKVYATYAEQAHDAETAYACQVEADRRDFDRLMSIINQKLDEALLACDDKCKAEVAADLAKNFPDFSYLNLKQNAAGRLGD